jgi:hypothetical protein
MNFFETILEPVPALVRVLFVFALMLVAIRKKVSLGNAFFFGALILGVLFGMGPLGLGRSVAWSLIHPKTLSLAVIVCLILVLSHSMEVTGQMKRLLDSFRGLIKPPRLNLVVFPALIGLLPMPGGAIFSAPMVKTLGARLNLSPGLLSYTNYWFRHVWEYWWPLYPGVLLTTALADLHLWVFVVGLFPLTLVSIGIGYVPLRGMRVEEEKGSGRVESAVGQAGALGNAAGPPDEAPATRERMEPTAGAREEADYAVTPEFGEDAEGGSATPGGGCVRGDGGRSAAAEGRTDPGHPKVKPFLKELIPILIAIGLGLGLGLVFSPFLEQTGVSKEIGLTVALLVAIGWVWRVNRLSFKERWNIVTQRQVLRVFYMVAGILIFKGMLEDSHAVEAISGELLALEVPLVPITMVLCFLVGGVTGITIAFVGTTFPIVISLVNSFGESQFMLAYMMLGLASGFAGVLLSPLHLCLLLSNEYFDTGLGRVYPHLVLPCGVLLAASWLYFMLLRTLMG